MESTTTIRPPRTIPRRGCIGREVWKSLPEGTRAQIIENQLIMAPAAPRGVSSTVRPSSKSIE